MSSKMTREEAERLRATYRAQMTKSSRAKAALPASPGPRAKKTTQNPETAILKAIVDTLQLRVPGLVLWRNNSGATRTQSGGFVRFGAVGSSDLLGVLAPEGRLVALEVKQPGKKPTAAQVSWLASVRAAGAVAGVVTSPEEALALLQEAGAKVLIPARPVTGPQLSKPALAPNKATAAKPAQAAPSPAFATLPKLAPDRADSAAKPTPHKTTVATPARTKEAPSKAAKPDKAAAKPAPRKRAASPAKPAPSKSPADTAAPALAQTESLSSAKEAAPAEKKRAAVKASPPKAAKKVAPQESESAPQSATAAEVPVRHSATGEKPAPSGTPTKAGKAARRAKARS